jgi:hypothetical protein
MQTATHKISSGLGGTLNVIILERSEGMLTNVRVVMPNNPDWDGYEFFCNIQDLTEINS